MLVLFILAILAAFLAVPVFFAAILLPVALRDARDTSLDGREERIERPVPVLTGDG